MVGSTPQRSSCRTAPRMSACVDTMSVPYTPLSTSSTRAPARREQQGGGRSSATRSDDDGVKFHGVHGYATHTRDIEPAIRCAITCASAPTPSMKLEFRRRWKFKPSTYRPGTRVTPPAWIDFPACIEHRHAQPWVRAPVSRGPDHRVDLFGLQIEAVGGMHCEGPCWPEHPAMWQPLPCCR